MREGGSSEVVVLAGSDFAAGCNQVTLKSLEAENVRAAVLNIFTLLVLLTGAVLARADVRSPWALAALMQRPVYEPAPGFHEERVEAIFFEGFPWRGKPTKGVCLVWISGRGRKEEAFWDGVSARRRGQAFVEWVRMWNRRGYAAITMDTTGSVPRPGESRDGFSCRRERHKHAGPAGWDDFENVDLPPQRPARLIAALEVGRVIYGKRAQEARNRSR